MNPYACYRLHFTPLSPIHIGTGESYEPTNYVIEDGALHEFDTGATMAALSGKDREELLRIASGRPNADMLKAVQRFFFERRDALKPWAVNRIPVLPGVASLYAQRVGQTANREGDGGQVVNRLEIDRAAYNPIPRRPVLFGSSLKGALRTALLDWLNNSQPARERKGLHEFQGRLLGYRDDAGKQRLELDPLRLVLLADAPWQEGNGLPAAQVYLAVNRKKHPVKDGGGQLRKAMGENLYQILECVPGWHCRAFSGQMTFQRVNGVSGNGQKLPAERFRFDMAQVAKSSSRFYLPILNAERKILKERGFVDEAWNAAVSDALRLAEARIKAGTAFLLRVGRHSGAESVTMGGEKVRQIRIMQGKGKPAATEHAARTLWLAANHKDQRQNLLPFGWLLVEVEPWEQPPQDWPELRALCEPHLGAARAFADRLESQRAAMAKIRAEAEAKRREEEAQARQRAEQEARAAREEAERQARLAAMSEEGQRIEQFRERLAREQAEWVRLGISGQWFQQLRALAQTAADWPTADKAALLVLVQDISQLDPKLSPKKNDHIKKLMKLIRSPSP
jgi:CRISPR-associated protein Csm5